MPACGLKSDRNTSVAAANPNTKHTTTPARAVTDLMERDLKAEQWR